MSATISRALAALLTLFVLALTPSAFADGRGNPGPDVAAPPVRTAPAPQTPAPQGRSGQIDLNNGLSLNVPDGYRFYSAEEAYAFMQRNNAQGPAGTVLGLLAPASERIDRPGAWATVVSYQDIGYVPGNTASGLAAPTFEADVRAARQTQNRAFEGFAVQPAFDDSAANLAWAERSAAPGSGGKDLRYEQKKLGRHGVACLTSIGSADQMAAMMAAAPDLIAMINFGEGQRYADYVAGTDPVSAYTVPALVTGVPPAASTNPQALASTTTTVTQSQMSFAGMSGYFPWVALGLVVLAGLGYLFTRRRADPNMTPDQ